MNLTWNFLMQLRSLAVTKLIVAFNAARALQVAPLVGEQLFEHVNSSGGRCWVSGKMCFLTKIYGCAQPALLVWSVVHVELTLQMLF
jgi:hypothetical protein